MLSPTARQARETELGLSQEEEPEEERKGCLMVQTLCILASWHASCQPGDWGAQGTQKAAPDGRELGTGQHKSPTVGARCHRRTKSCCQASTGEQLLDSNIVLRKQNPCIAAQETVRCPKAGSGTGHTSLSPHEAPFERQRCSGS